MLSKVLFTLAVIAGVVVFFRRKPDRASAPTSAPADPAQAPLDPSEEGRSVSTRALAYGVLGVLAAVSATIFALNWHSGNRVVPIRVISDGAATDYQARCKSVKGRNFVTPDGIRITLGENDRIEMIEPC